MEKDIFEVVLKKHARESSINRTIDLKLESALPKGENYTSTIFRATLKVILGNGRIATKTFILKKETVEERTDQVLKDYMFCKAEVSIYRNVLTNMEYLMEEFGDPEGPLWCKFIHFNPSESTIILEDLKASGFSTVKRTEFQDLAHARLALRGLARYHGMAKVLEERGLLSFDGYKAYQLLYDQVFYRAIIYGGMLALVKGMRATWGEEWTETADHLSRLSFEVFSKIIIDCGHFDEETFRCLNHGDGWNNNMMFKHNWEGTPIEMRLIDFQNPHYNSPCVDVIYYMYTSIQPQVRRQNYKSLIKFYHDSLTSTLDKFGFKGTKPGFEEIEANLERLSFFALSLFASSCAIDSSSTTDAFDWAVALKTRGQEGFNVNIFSEEGIKEKIGEDLKRLVDKIKGLF